MSITVKTTVKTTAKNYAGGKSDRVRNNTAKPTNKTKNKFSDSPIHTRGRLLISACASGKPLAEKIFQKLKEKANPSEKGHIHFVETEEICFANGEIKTVIKESIRGGDLYIFQDVENSVMPYSVNDNLMALKTHIDAAKRSDAKMITVVVPVFPYARQDKSSEREGITAARIAQEFEQHGADYILTFDIHNTAIKGFFRQAKLENLRASKNIIDFVRSNINCENLVIASPDTGGTKRAEFFAQKLGRPFVVCYKPRDYSVPNKVERLDVLGHVKDCDVLAVDDMIDTAGTVEKACTTLKKVGAKRIYFACSLPLFNGRAIDILDRLYREGLLDMVIGTDTVYHGEDFSIRYPWYKVVSIASYLAKVIRNLNCNESISKLLE
jgi:ribose-phosphate pyrophosphokinase